MGVVTWCGHVVWSRGAVTWYGLVAWVELGENINLEAFKNIFLNTLLVILSDPRACPINNCVPSFNLSLIRDGEDSVIFIPSDFFIVF